jgi:transposase
MAVKKKKSSKEKVSKSKAKTKSKKSAKKKVDKEPRVTRKDFILGLVENAGKKGISTSAIVEKTDAEFEYDEGKSSRMRVNNTIKDAAADGTVKVKDGLVNWKG